MRLGDLDKLKKEILNHPMVLQQVGESCIGLQTVIDTIDNAPTVDKLVHGGWIHRQITENWSAVQCSVCHTTWDYESRFCPNCGAYMMEV